MDKLSEKEKLLQTDRDFARTSLEIGPAEAFKKYLDKDAFMLPNGAMPVFGRDSIYSDMIGDYTLEWEPVDGDVAKSGDFGYTWGTYISRSKNDTGKEVIRKGKYLNVWKKNSEGSWKVLIDMGNTSTE